MDLNKELFVFCTENIIHLLSKKNFETKIEIKESEIKDIKYCQKIDDEKFMVNEGDAYLLYPKTKEKYYSDKNEPFQKYWVNFVGSDINRILDALNIKGIHHFPKCNLMSYFIQLYSLEESYMNSLDFSYYAYSTIISMLVEMKKSLIANKKGVDTADKIKEIIDNHISENIKVLDICDELKMCKSSIINIFKNKYHITPNQYKNNKKMDVAKNMLINENISIKQISISLGFIDQYHFSNSFKLWISLQSSSSENGIFSLTVRPTRVGAGTAAVPVVEATEYFVSLSPAVLVAVAIRV